MSISFLTIGIIAYILGINNLAGVTTAIGESMLYAFVLLAIASYLYSRFKQKTLQDPD
jgi:uncharacterized membrane protein YtjA (UPF0391 family)